MQKWMRWTLLSLVLGTSGLVYATQAEQCDCPACEDCQGPPCDCES